MIKIKIKFLIFIVIIALFSYFAGGNLSYSILYTTLLILVFGLIHINLQRVTMKAYINISPEVFRTGDVLNINITVKSFSPFPAGFLLVENKGILSFKKNYKGDVAFLNYHKEKNFSNQLHLKVRGIYDFSETNVYFTDLFCTMKTKKRFAQTKYIKVYPRICKINEENFNEGSISQNSNRNLSIAEDSNVIRDFRLYRQGDSLKKVNWKLSAKHNEIYVKDFEEVVSNDANIILNMNKHDAATLEEEMIELAVSVIDYLLAKQLKVKLLINNEEDKTFNVDNNSDFQFLMEYFINNKSQGQGNLIDYLDSKVRTFKQGSWIGVITIDVNQALIKEIMELVNLGFKLCVFYGKGNNLEFLNEQRSRGLELIKWEEATFSQNE